jgi:hypothetical protein
VANESTRSERGRPQGKVSSGHVHGTDSGGILVVGVAGPAAAYNGPVSQS